MSSRISVSVEFEISFEISNEAHHDFWDSYSAFCSDPFDILSGCEEETETPLVFM